MKIDEVKGEFSGLTGKHRCAFFPVDQRVRWLALLIEQPKLSNRVNRDGGRDASVADRDGKGGL